MTTWVDVDIPGGPVRVRLVGRRRGGSQLCGWWVVGRRHLQIALGADGLWRLTGHGFDRRDPADRETPTPRIRAAARAYLRRHYSPGARVSVYGFDGRGDACSWGWDDVETFLWSDERTGEHGALWQRAAVEWIRAQIRAVGMVGRTEDYDTPRKPEEESP